MPTEGTHLEDPTVTTMAPQNASTSRGDTLDERKQPSRHPGQTILVFSVALAPLIILPYVLVRRHVVGLRKEIAELRRANVVLVKETRTSMQAMSQQHTAASDRASQLLEDTRDLLVKVRSEVEAGREATQVQEARLERVEDHLSQLMTAVKDTDREAGVRAAELKNMLSVMINTAKERENKAQAWRKSTSATMEVLLDEKRVRQLTAAALGRSLADMAAFAQEVEVRQGWVPRPNDGRGIERMRRLAKHLDESATTAQPLRELKQEPQAGAPASLRENRPPFPF